MHTKYNYGYNIRSWIFITSNDDHGLKKEKEDEKLNKLKKELISFWFCI